jgi:anti-sigma28 factor (negative regulator of flagellin synthesis)
MGDKTTDGHVQTSLQSREAYLEELRHLIGSGSYDIPAVVIAESMIDHLERLLDRSTN